MDDSLHTAPGPIRIQETNVSGQVLTTYSLTTTDTTNTSTTESSSTSSKTRKTTRLDHIPSSDDDHGHLQKRSNISPSVQKLVSTRLALLFLPIGYPHTVTSDYTPYQIYDSLQAFSSTIAGLLSSRAVLQSLGMGSSDSSATSTATYVTLLSIARSTISNFSMILFADYMSGHVSGQVKFYRFLADIMNDAGFLLEMISPSLPEHFKVPSLCLCSALRAMCGVAGGSSKAILSAHFAMDGNIGELNAKDGSQETLVNLVGMWIGGVLVSKVDSRWATWSWLIVLLSLHLWFNWLAVTSVRLKGLNVSRAGMVFRTLVRDARCPGPDEIGQHEKVFDRTGSIRDEGGRLILTGRVGVGVGVLASQLGGRKHSSSGSSTIAGVTMPNLIAVFAREQYLLWLAPNGRNALILLKEQATRDDQLKALCHVMRITDQVRGAHLTDEEMLRNIVETLSVNNERWQWVRQQIEDAGWDISATVLETTAGLRVRQLASQ